MFYVFTWSIHSGCELSKLLQAGTGVLIFRMKTEFYFRSCNSKYFVQNKNDSMKIFVVVVVFSVFSNNKMNFLVSLNEISKKHIADKLLN